ncbi:hypothetical protein HK100_004434, partial [Physocladia obscura]
MASGLRWAFTQVLLMGTNKTTKGKTNLGEKNLKRGGGSDGNPFAALHKLSPVMGILFAACSVVFEAAGDDGWL